MTCPVGVCPKCGQGGIQPVKIKVQPASFVKPDRYCAKCGHPLFRTCTACNGTGKTHVPVSVFSDEPCSECGRLPELPDDTCHSCGGTGEIFEEHHYCPRRSEEAHLPLASNLPKRLMPCAVIETM